MARDRVAGAPYFKSFAVFARNGGSPLYERLALDIAGDREMLAFAALARPEQPQANVLFAAVHALLLSGAKHPLTEYYPSCGGKRAADDGAYPEFKSFVAHERERLETLIRTRVTNTNEVGRSALLYPAYDVIAGETDAPLNIIEIGPSAGLNLNWFRYGYRYLKEAEPLLARNDRAALFLSSELHGPRQPKLAQHLPEIRSITGLELNPVELSSPHERLWLRALIWPERLDRLRRLDAALAIAEQHPPRIERGSASADLAKLIALAPPGPLTIAHTLVTYQFSPEQLAAFEWVLKNASRSRSIYEVGVEWDGSHYPISLTRYRAGESQREELARCDPHGGWIEWLAD